ncbi:MAG TPA: hypothetical protein VJT67_15575 [Longimicrobiaceae bacterium]|nr:hypothetical protein [Longimicrobiaceae bacterium]
MTMRKSRSLLRAAAALAAAALAGCNDTSMPHPPTTVDPVGSAAVSGTAGKPVADSIAVKVTDADGFPVRGVEVMWITQPGSGTVSPATSVTNSSGIARTQWTLGTTAGTQAMYAAVSLLEDEAQFTATAAPGPAATVQVAPTPLSLLVGEQRALTVTVRDQYGNAVSGGFPTPVLNSSAPLVASVNGTTAQGNSPGTAQITATVAGVPGTGFTDVTVARPVIASLSRGGNSEAICALDTAGNAFCWGFSNSYAAGQAGGNAVRPRMIAGGHHFTKVSTNGLGVSCGLESGMVWCWGQVGQSGGNPVLTTTPVLAAGPTNMTDIAFGRYACAIQAQNTPYCWNGYITGEPAVVVGGGPFHGVEASATQSCILRASSLPWCWGDNTDLQLGRDQTGCNPSGAPVTYTCPAPAPITNIQVYSGGLRLGVDNSCGSTGGATWYCWGRADYNLLQQPEPKQCRLQVGLFSYLDTCTKDPVPMSTTPPLVSLTPGWDAICGLTAAGQAYCWGAGFSGQLGNGSTADNPTPTAVAGGHTFTSLAAGGVFFCGIDNAGQVWCWGQNDSGQLGNGTTTDSPVPVAVF